PCRHAIVVNAGLGLGTLVHEIVHPLMHASFPQAPVWLDEGVASLFEQPAERDETLVGLVNWRLPELQRRLRDRRPPALGDVLAAGRSDFDDEKLGGAYYAVARYLCFYLQEQGKLQGFFRSFRQAQAEDPTGEQSLLGTLHERSLETFGERFTRFVLGLRFRRQS